MDRPATVEPTTSFRCGLCLEDRTDLAFATDPPRAWLCRRCRDQSIRVLKRDQASDQKL